MKKGNTVGPCLMQTSLLQLSILLLRNLFTKALMNQHKAKISTTRGLPRMGFCSPTYAIFATLCSSGRNCVSGVDYCSPASLRKFLSHVFFSVFHIWRNEMSLKIFQQPAQMPREDSSNLLKSL